MDVIPKNKKLLITGYVVLLALSVMYVNKVLNTETIEVKQKEKAPKSDDRSIVDVGLVVDNGTDTQYYKTQLKNTDNVRDLLDDVRISTDFTYETTKYSYGVVFDSVNRHSAPQGYSWKLYGEDNADITQTYANVTVNNDTTYYLKLVKE